MERKWGSTSHFVNVTAVFLDDNEMVNLPYGSYTTAILNDDKKYECLQKHLTYIVRDIDSFREIVHDGVTYTIEYSLGGV